MASVRGWKHATCVAERSLARVAAAAKSKLLLSLSVSRLQTPPSLLPPVSLEREREIFVKPLPFFERTRIRTCGPPRQGGVVAVSWRLAALVYMYTYVYMCAYAKAASGDSSATGRPVVLAWTRTIALSMILLNATPARGKRGRGQPALALLSS